LFFKVMKTDTSKSHFAFFDSSVSDFYLMHLQVTAKLCCFFFCYLICFIIIYFFGIVIFLRNCLLAFVCLMCCCCIKVEIFGAICRRDLNFVPWGYMVEFLSLSRHCLDIFVNFYKNIIKLLYGSFLAVFFFGLLLHIQHVFLSSRNLKKSYSVFCLVVLVLALKTLLICIFIVKCAFVILHFLIILLLSYWYCTCSTEHILCFIL